MGWQNDTLHIFILRLKRNSCHDVCLTLLDGFLNGSAIAREIYPGSGAGNGGELSELEDDSVGLFELNIELILFFPFFRCLSSGFSSTIAAKTKEKTVDVQKPGHVAHGV